MNSLASILYSSSPVNTKKRTNLSLQSSLKPLSTKPSRCQVGMLFRSSTPKTPLQSRTKPTVAAHPTTLSNSSSPMSLSIQSPQSPRCSTPVFAKQRRTRAFLACELCRQRAFQSMNADDNKTQENPIKRKNSKPPTQHHHHHHSATLQYYQYQTNTRSIRRRRSSIDKLLVWIV